MMPSEPDGIVTHRADGYVADTGRSFQHFFSNLSDDIRAPFCSACDRLGLRWTQSNPRSISISHRMSVALLDEYVGPKR